MVKIRWEAWVAAASLLSLATGCASSGGSHDDAAASMRRLRLPEAAAVSPAVVALPAAPGHSVQDADANPPKDTDQDAAGGAADSQDADAKDTAPKSEVTSAKDVAAGKPAAGSENSLREQSQNPVADLVSVPFQFNATQNTGSRRNGSYVLNIQPVYPFHLNDDWNLITRTIIPLRSQSQQTSHSQRTRGLGDTTIAMFFSPTGSKPIWGAGPVFYLPTATDGKLGTDQWGVGPTAVVLDIDGKWVYGGVGSHVWSVGGPNGSSNDLSFTSVQPFVNYNMDDGWYLTSSPIITGDWEADKGSDVWTVPLGGGFGRVVHSKIPVNYQLQGFYNVHHPNNAGNWSMRLQITLLLPKGKPKGTT
jgi:hypothetical protein